MAVLWVEQVWKGTMSPPHCLRKTFTVPELLTSATAAALVTPGAGGVGVARSQFAVPAFPG